MGRTSSHRKTKNNRVRNKLKLLDERYKEAVELVDDSKVLLPEQQGFLEAEEGEKTFKFRQEDIVKELDEATQRKKFKLDLDFGPYFIDYTRNGRDLLIAGRKGHIASFDWRNGILKSEIHVNETVRDIKWLHNDQFYAAAQKKYVYIYDSQGVEVHKLKSHIEVNCMDFLPYHFLLATAGNTGWLKYQDTSTGELVSELRTKLGASQCMAQNPYNAVINLGHANGTVTLWSPTVSTPLVKILSHRGPVRSIACDREGRYMATAGADSRIKVWDVRMFKEMHSYYVPKPASSLHISDTGLLAVGWGPHVHVWKDALKSKEKSPYMTHLNPGSAISDVRFCPFEDVLGFGSDSGFESLIVPGAGEANFDTYETNPYETAEQRREREVKMLLDKLQPDMISLDPEAIGKVDPRAPSSRDRALAEQEQAAAEAKVKTAENLKIKARARGKNSALRRYLRKRTKNVIDERKQKIEQMLNDEKSQRQQLLRAERGETEQKEYIPAALSRFTN
ncbi:hypothetical protein CANCADRAFT_2507 [Tortispora caseinolytica NRRL Y-17796]|uniref:U three protein 7 n=1 Tax=Tortispora caseinolytica NRRL Y-17796 TaxID=767744 RepID=A0A1E4TG82_9ASCO|nr:hypothetical protein CANCADRAFT_2507 [Tortispora caseinolytica NRRL Y-17796]